MATRNTPAAATPSTDSTASAKFDSALDQIAAASRSSVAGSVANSAATTAAASWISTHAKLDVFGTGKIWVPTRRTKTLHDKEAKEFLVEIWDEMAALTTNGTPSPQETSETIIKLLMNSVFILSQVWEDVSPAFCRAANGILINNVIWTKSDQATLLKLPLRSRMRNFLSIILEKEIPNVEERAAFTAGIGEELPPFLKLVASAPVEVTIVQPAVKTSSIPEMKEPYLEPTVVPRDPRPHETVPNMVEALCSGMAPEEVTTEPQAESAKDRTVKCTVRSPVQKKPVELKKSQSNTDQMSEVETLKTASLQSQKDMQIQKEQVKSLFADELVSNKASTQASIDEFKVAMMSDQQRIEEAKANSISTLAIDNKLPADPTKFKPSIQNKISISYQRRNENAIKGAASSTSKPFDLTSPSPCRKGARGQSIHYFGSQSGKTTGAPEFICYAATPKDANFVRRDDDPQDDEDNPLRVWFRASKDAHGINTNQPDLSTICKENMVPFDLQNPPPWVDMTTSGRNGISRFATSFSVMANGKDCTEIDKRMVSFVDCC